MKELAGDILDTFPAILFHIDDAGNVLDFRPSKFIQNHPKPSKLPCPLGTLLPESKAAKIVRLSTTLEENGPPQPCRYSLLSNNLESHFEGRLSKTGDMTTVVVWDASERTKVEKEKEHLYRQLRQHQKTEALGQLTSGIAHDFNNILASILGYADLALDALETMGDPELLRYLQEIIDSGESARDLIVQMLAFARARPSDAIALMPSPLIKETIKILQSSLPSTIELNVSTEENLPQIKVDPTQFHQAIINLCINARDAIEEKGNINISVSKVQCQHADCSACQEHFEGEYIEITISDNGCGINPTFLNKIFEPFFTTKESNRNTGMGLSVAHGVIHDSHGHIVVDSQPDFGTTFRLYLPSIAKQKNIAPSLDNTRTFRGISMNAHILVVDDEESVARLQGELLQAKGFSVSVFSDPLQALDTIKGNPDGFDMLLADQTMPGLTGIELAKKALELCPHLPVVLNSAQGDRDYTGEAKAAGINAFLSKPIPSEVLLNTVVGLLKKSRAC